MAQEQTEVAMPAMLSTPLIVPYGSQHALQYVIAGQNKTCTAV